MADEEEEGGEEIGEEEEEAPPPPPPPPEEEPEEVPEPPPPEVPEVEPPPPEVLEEPEPPPEIIEKPISPPKTQPTSEARLPVPEQSAGNLPPPPPPPEPEQKLPFQRGGTAEAKKASSEESEESEGDEKQKRAQIQGGTHSPRQSIVRKRKHSIAAHLQGEINKQKIVQAKQDRERRRGDLKVHHHYLFEHIASIIDLKPKEVEEFIIDSQSYIDLIENFFKKGGTKAVLFSYQEADPPGPESGRPILGGQGHTKTKEKMLRVLVSNGSDIPLKGACLYFIRVNGESKITLKNIAEETYFGQLPVKNQDEPGAVLETLCYVLNTVYLKNLKGNSTWVTIPDPEIATTVRHKFLTSITHYANFLTDSKNDISSRLDLREICDMDELTDKYMRTSEETIEAAKNPDIVAKVEHTVILWCKNIERVLALSKQMRKETDAMGPTAELAYWRNLMGKMCSIIEQVQTWRFVHCVQVLVHSKSRVLRRWLDVDARVTDEIHEAKDNVRYMYALEKFCEPLYQFNPPAMCEHISSMMYTIRTIHTTSRYYNSTEKVTALMIKISNQMVSSCRYYLTKDGVETIWNQDKRDMVEKLKKCLELYATYRGNYESTKAELEENPDGKRFDFSINHIFGRFEKFCERLKKIIEIVEIFDMYQFVHMSRIDGIEGISERLNNSAQILAMKTYDPLEFRDPIFDEDYVMIRAELDEIEKSLETFMDKSIEACPTAMHGVQLLERFENLRNRCLDIEGKKWYLFQFYHNEINLLKSIYEAEKNETPIPRGYPPFAGKIAWCRHLLRRLERPMNWFRDKTKILLREEAKPTIKLYNTVLKKLVHYEILFHDAFVKAVPNIYDSLEAPILCIRGNVRQELVLNFDPFFRQIIDEVEIIRKMEPLEVPDVALIVYFKQAKLFSTYETMKGLLERFLSVKSKIPNDLMVLIRPLIKKVEKSFMPGISTINWTSSKCEEYFGFISSHLDELETMVYKVGDIIALRINQCLVEIAHTMMIDLPDERPMHTHEYMEKIRNYGAVVSKDLEYKSRSCESATIELINTLLASTDLPVPDELLYSWMNQNIFDKDTTGMDRGRAAMAAMVADLSQSVREELAHIHEESRHVFLFYSSKCIEALQKTTRISLDILRKRTEEPQVSKRNPTKILNRVPLFIAELTLVIPTIQLRPPVEDLQMFLTRSSQLVVESLKRVVQWGQTRRSSFDTSTDESYYKNKEPTAEQTQYQRLQAQEEMVRASIPVENLNSKLKNCFKLVMDYKDISKMMLMMQTVVTQAKPKITQLIQKYSSYNYLWRDERTEEIKTLLAKSPAVTEIEAIVKKWKNVADEIQEIQPSHRIGPLEVMTGEMKLAYQVELKTWQHILCRLLSEEYKLKTTTIAKFIDECSKDLSVPIRELNDIRFLMSVLERVRDKYVDYERLLTPIEEVYFFLNGKQFKVPEEESGRADTLRYNFNKLQARTLEVQDKLCSIQDSHKKILAESISKLQKDIKVYEKKYRKSGPAVEGLKLEDASDRLVTYQDEFDEMMDRFTTYTAGEKLFGLIPTEYPDLMKLKKELAILQFNMAERLELTTPSITTPSASLLK